MRRSMKHLMSVIRVPCLDDNYAWLLHDNGCTAVVDTPEVGPICEALDQQGWNLDIILNTHHHADHVGGNTELVNKYSCEVWGSSKGSHRIPEITRKLCDGDEILIGNHTARVIETPGHTIDHICYYFNKCNKVFVGDTLFSMGCGRLFEGTPSQMLSSLQKLMSLPPSTEVYCAHEYTAHNANFSLTVDGNNPLLQTRHEEVMTARSKNIATIPTTIQTELDTNPFLRSACGVLRGSMGFSNTATDLEVFTAVRERRNNF